MSSGQKTKRHFSSGSATKFGEEGININYVYGPDGRQPWMPEVAWLCVWMLAQPLLLVGPTHLLLRRFAPAPRG